jgi:excisionase family DNA binding protein
MAALTPDDVARDLSIHRDTAARKMRTGEIPAFPVGRYWRSDPELYAEWKRRGPAVVDPHGIAPRSSRSEAALGRRRTA